MISNVILAIAPASIGRIALRVLPVVALGVLAPSLLTQPAHAATLGRYCSMTWSGGGWALRFYTNLTSDPCGEMNAQWPGGSIQRAGLYSVGGMTNVVARCGNSGYVIMYQGAGYGPLTAAFNQAVADKQQNCIFTAAPRDLPIFVSPIDPATPGLSHSTGFDFAREPYKVLDTVTEFGQPFASFQSQASPIVDWQGRDKSDPALNYVNDHDGHDVPMPIGTKVVAVAAGKVLAARYRDVEYIDQKYCPGTIKTQGEVYIEHTISGATGQVVLPGGPTTPYDEKIISYYAHLSEQPVNNQSGMNVSAGQLVNQGDQIGLSGNSGCSSGKHLHFGTVRITNTAGHRVYPLQINTSFGPTDDQNSDNTKPVAIEPFGFSAPKGFDPWAWRAYPNGALSINLWSGPTFSPGSW